MLLEELVVWQDKSHAMLKLALPSAGRGLSQLLPLSSSADLSAEQLASTTGATRGWDNIVGSIMTVTGETDNHCYFDPVTDEVASMDGTRRQVFDLATLQDMITSGIAIAGESDFWRAHHSNQP